MNNNGKVVPVRLRPVTSGPVRLQPRPGAPLRPVRSVTPPQEPSPPNQRTPRNRRGGWWKGVLVVVFATTLTTLAIKASDRYQSNTADTQIAGIAGSGEVSRCPEHMIFVPTADGGFCIDQYENSPGPECVHQFITNEFGTGENVGDPKCLPVSLPNKDPWVNVAAPQAAELCARAGKRLPTNSEWYRAAMGTPDTAVDGKYSCVLGRTGASAAEMTGASEGCVSSFGAYDMVGNAWEWVDAYVAGGWYNNRVLPDEGYVAEVDADGVAAATSATSSSIFHNDYFFIDKTGVRSMFRGGYWNMTDKAGIDSINATMQSSFLSVAIGFRCAK